MRIVEKRNLNCLESEENEELEIMKGIRELFRFLSDEKICRAIIDRQNEVKKYQQ